MQILTRLLDLLGFISVLFALIYMFVDPSSDAMLSSCTGKYYRIATCAYYWTSIAFLIAIHVFVKHSYGISDTAGEWFEFLNSELPHMLVSTFVSISVAVFSVDLHIRAFRVCTELEKRPDINAIIFCHNHTISNRLFSGNITNTNNTTPTPSANEDVELIKIFFKFFRPLILLLYVELVTVALATIILSKIVSPSSPPVETHQRQADNTTGACSIDNHGGRREEWNRLDILKFAVGLVLTAIITFGPVARLYFRINKEKHFTEDDMLMYIEPYSRLVSFLVLALHILYFYIFWLKPAVCESCQLHADEDAEHYWIGELAPLAVSFVFLLVYAVFTVWLSVLSIKYYNDRTQRNDHFDDHFESFIWKTLANFVGLIVGIGCSFCEIFFILRPLYIFGGEHLKNIGRYGAAFVISLLIFHASELIGMYFASAFMDEVINKFVSQNSTASYYTAMLEVVLGLTTSSAIVSSFDFTCALICYVILTRFWSAGLNPFKARYSLETNKPIDIDQSPLGSSTAIAPNMPVVGYQIGQRRKRRPLTAAQKRKRTLRRQLLKHLKLGKKEEATVQHSCGTLGGANGSGNPGPDNVITVDIHAEEGDGGPLELDTQSLIP